MVTILKIILVVALVFGIGAFIFSQKSDPGERAKEAGAAAATGAVMTTGCLLQAIMSALPVLLGIFLLAMIVRGCN